MTEKPATLELHVQPGARKDEVLGFREGVLWVKVKAPPVKGQANDGLVEFLAEILSVPRSNLTIARGQGGRRKLIEVRGLTTENLRKRLDEASSGRRLL